MISVVTPIFNPKLSELEKCLESVGTHQSVEHLLAVDGPDALDNVEEFDYLAGRYGAKVVRLVEHGGISVATNAAAEIADGEMLLFLDQDDFLIPNWEKFILPLVGKFDVIYSDRETADENGEIIKELQFRKPDWSPWRLRGNMYLSHFFAVRKTLFFLVGGMRKEFDGSQDHDLILRILETEPHVNHVAEALYAWRQSPDSTALNPAAKPYAAEAGIAAVNEYNMRVSNGVKTVPVKDFPGFYKHIYPPRTNAVSVVIPTGFGLHDDGLPIIELAIQALSQQLNNVADEVIVVSAGEDKNGSIERIREVLQCRLIHVIDDQPFNFSVRVNLGAIQASNEKLIFLNDDVIIQSNSAIDSLSFALDNNEIGAAGIQLIFPDGRIQHAGHAYYTLAAHHPYYLSDNLAQNFGDLILDREVSGVTGACLATRKSVWKNVGGFTAKLPLNYNDVDFCLKIRESGLSIIQLNSITGVHFESTTRDPRLQDWELKFLRHRWAHRIWRDSFTRVQESEGYIF